MWNISDWVILKFYTEIIIFLGIGNLLDGIDDLILILGYVGEFICIILICIFYHLTKVILK